VGGTNRRCGCFGASIFERLLCVFGVLGVFGHRPSLSPGFRPRKAWFVGVYLG
jgi:hypothetical protein